MRLLQTLSSGAFEIVDVGRVFDRGSTLPSTEGVPKMNNLPKASNGGHSLDGSTLPLMPPPTEPDYSWIGALRTFHLTGHDAQADDSTTSRGPLRPVAIDLLATEGESWAQFPLYLPAARDVFARPFYDVLMETLKAHPTTILWDSTARFMWGVVRELAEAKGLVALSTVLEPVMSSFAAEFELSAAGLKTLQAELEMLAGALPSTGQLLGLNEHTLPILHVLAVRRARESRVLPVRAKVTHLIARLGDLLRVDDAYGPEGTSASALSSSLGSAAGAFFDPSKLSTSISSQNRIHSLDPERRARVIHTRMTLESFLEGLSEDPDVFLLHDGSLAEGLALDGVSLRQAEDGLTAALELFEARAKTLEEVLRAVRLADLEVDNAYEAGLHEEILQRFGWQGFSAEELLLLPNITVYGSVAGLKAKAMGAFTRLLCSGRPIQVLLSDRVAPADDSWERLSGYDPGLGYLSIAHREAFVLQSTLGRPEHCVAGLLRMAEVVRPAVAIVAIPSDANPVPAWLELSAAHEGRANPCFSYDPDRGETWAERFDLSVNPDLQATWPTKAIAYLDEKGNEHSLEYSFSFADVSALEPAYREHFKVIPTQAWSDEQIPLSEFVEKLKSGGILKIPYIWVLTENGQLARAITTREIAFASYDRARSWRILQELAGTNNEYAIRAVRDEREAAALEAAEAFARMEANHAAELEKVRVGAAKEAMERLVGVLLNLDSVPMTAAAGSFNSTAPVAAKAPVASEDVASAPAPAAAAPAPAVEEEVVSFNDPYIDTVLCTSCNECVNINPKVFLYDGNKQVYIDDPTKGTFAQLVTAASKCPARCIHPGVPRAGDATATDEVITQAAPFN